LVTVEGGAGGRGLVLGAEGLGGPGLLGLGLERVLVLVLVPVSVVWDMVRLSNVGIDGLGLLAAFRGRDRLCRRDKDS